jgi:hypothetical protein
MAEGLVEQASHIVMLNEIIFIQKIAIHLNGNLKAWLMNCAVI